LVVPAPKRSRSPSPDDVLPGCKRSKLGDVPVNPESDTAPSPVLDWNENRNDSNDSVTTASIPDTETKVSSPVSVVAIDFDSAMGHEDDSEEEQVETVGLDTTVDLSEDDDVDKVDSDSSDEVAVIKEKVKPEPKKSRRKATNQRRNIKELMGQEHLDVATLAAQKEEWARRERIAAKQKSLGMGLPNLPLSMEQIMERFSSASSVVSVTQLGVTDSEKSKKPTAATRSPPTEHEVLTLSSDDEDCVPCYESILPSPQDQDENQQPPVLLPVPRHYDSYASETNSSRSRYSGGTMIINNRDNSDITFGDELEESEKSPEEIVDDDDDDCVVLSPPPADALDDEKDEDAYNVPDELGRVLVNVGHRPDEPDIFLAPQIAKAVKPHQVGAQLIICNR